MADYDSSWDNEIARPAKLNTTSLFSVDTRSNLPTSGFETEAKFLVIDENAIVRNTGNKASCTWTDSVGKTASGIVQMWAGSRSSPPSGWLLCNGSAISRTTYANLFSAIGTRFGAGDGSTTFNLPDFRAKFPRGAPNNTDGGGTGGNDTHQHTIPAETVNWDVASSTQNGFMNNVSGSGTAGNQIHYSSSSFGAGRYNDISPSFTGGTSFNKYQGSATLKTQGQTLSTTDNRPAFLEILFIIKT